MVVSSDHELSSVRGSINSFVMALATLTPRNLRNRFILTFQIGKFKPSNFGGDLMLEKSSDAMDKEYDAQKMKNATSNIAKYKDLPKVVKPSSRVRL